MAKNKEPVIGHFVNKNIVTEDSDKAREFYHKNRFGEIKEKHVYLSFYEALYLMQRDKLSVLDNKNNSYDTKRFVRKIKDKQFLINYSVFNNLRAKGYTVKTALKFGAEFRVYDKGVKPGEEHAKWIVFVVHESEKQTWRDFSAKNRVAHSTKKNLLIAVVDDELDISYWEVKWTKP